MFLKKQLVRSKFNLPGNIKGVAGFKRRTELYPKYIGARVKPHQPSFLILFLNRMLKYLRFVQDCSVCANNKESTS